MRVIEKVKKKINKVMIERALRKERTYRSGIYDTDIHYLYFPEPSSDSLVIVFSAYNDNGPVYSYLSSLRKIHVNKLFIKDDFFPRTGNYYLGNKGRYNNESAVMEFIHKMVHDSRAKKLIFAGSSKGGYAALNFGLRYPGAYFVVGGPQYHLAWYMTDTKKFRPALCDIIGVNDIGEITKKQREDLDDRLPSKIRNNKNANTQHYYIHCSTKEPTYKKHVADLIRDLKGAGADVIFDAADYEDHSDLRYYFPPFLKGRIHEIIIGKVPDRQ